MRERPLRAVLSAALLLAVLPTVTGSGSPASAQTAEDPQRMRVYVGDGFVVESAEGTATLQFPIVVTNKRFHNQAKLRYSTVLRSDDTAESADFVPVIDRVVSLGSSNQIAVNMVVMAGQDSPVTVEVNADALDDDPIETFTLVVEAVDDFDVETPEAKGHIVDSAADPEEIVPSVNAPMCVFDQAAGILAVAHIEPALADDATVTISRKADSQEILVGAACIGGTPTVDTVDLVVVEPWGGASVITGDKTVVIDLGNGPFAPGIEHDGIGFVDAFNDSQVIPPSADPDGTDPKIEGPSASAVPEDNTPEIEFDVRFPYISGRLHLLGSEAPDHIVAGSRICPTEPDPDPHCAMLNLNLNGDGDADVHVSLGTDRLDAEREEPNSARAWIERLEAHGFGGDDFLSLGGGYGTGGPVRPFIQGPSGGRTDTQNGVKNAYLYGGNGDDVVIGGDGGVPTSDPVTHVDTVEEIHGGPGDDILIGGAGIDHLYGGPGHDVFDQGDTEDGPDVMHGGPGHDTVDYSKRVTHTSADNDPPDPVDHKEEPDDGQVGERDLIMPDVEAWLVPSIPPPTTVPGLDVVGELKNAPGCRPRSSPYSDYVRTKWTTDEHGPCPLLVDSERNLGISAGSALDLDGENRESRIVVYDLETLKRVAAPPGKPPFDLERAALDSARERVYGAPPPDYWRVGSAIVPIANAGTCTVPYLAYGPDPETGVPAPELGLLTYAGESECLAVHESAGCVPVDEVVEEGECVPVDEIPTIGTAPERAPLFVPGTRLPMRLYGVAFDEGGDDLYLSGSAGVDTARRPQGGSAGTTGDDAAENMGAALLVRKVHLEGDRAQVAWDLDLRYAGCGRRNPNLSGDPVWAAFVGRVGNDLLVSCWDSRFWSVGAQGYLVRIPLDPVTGEPLPREGTGGTLVTDANGAYANYRAVRTPTLPGDDVRVLHDPASDTLMLATTGSLNGNAVYVFDPAADSFVGVAAGGAASQPIANDAVGLDPVRGRVYLLTAEGVVVFPTRTRPLPGGRLFGVAANNPFHPYRDWANNSIISVDAKLRRLFIPVNLHFAEGGLARWLVVDDTTPDPQVSRSDPDLNTAQVDEGPGTEVRSFAEATASGAHVVYAGGPVRTADSVDPGCFADVNLLVAREQVALEPEVFGNRQCAADQVLAPGHREFSLAASEAEAASGTAAVAEASGLTFDENDVSTRDVEAAGACEAGLLAALTRGGFSSPDFDEGCGQFWDGMTGQGEAATGDPRDPRGEVSDPRAGTKGRDRRGFPVPGTACSDFGGSPKSPEPAGVPAVASAQVSCDVAGVSATAASEAAGFILSHDGAPLVSVARSESSTTTAKTAEGQVTVSAAKAEGVVVGPLSIREVRSVAVTRAKGRTGTAVTELERRWCGVTLADQGVGDEDADPQAASPASSPAGCIDPTSAENEAFLEQVNFALGGKLRITVTRANEETEPGGTVEEGTDSTGGYEAVLIKHDDARGGDAAVNDDDSITVAGLQAIVYNDSPQGRNRIVVQLAGVHAESRYGITELPDFSGFDGFGGFFSEPTFTSGTPGTPGYTIPGASDLVEGETFETVIITRGRPGVGATDPIDNLLQWVPEAVKDLLRLLVQHPLEFLLLFGVFSLLAAPAYMAHRRRQFIGVVTS